MKFEILIKLCLIVKFLCYTYLTFKSIKVRSNLYHEVIMNLDSKFKDIATQLKTAHDYLGIGHIEKGLGALVEAEEGLQSLDEEANDPVVKKFLPPLLQNIEKAVESYNSWANAIEAEEGGEEISEGNEPEPLHEEAFDDLQDCRDKLQKIIDAREQEREN